LEASAVIALRTLKIAAGCGGRGSPDTSEKIEAGLAMQTLALTEGWA
jgi:hypothetical protein